MGIENRDYYRESSEPPVDFIAPGGVVSRRILITCIAVFIGQFLFDGAGGGFDLTEAFVYNTPKIIYEGQIWRIFTCAFCHSTINVYHILFNMLFLHWFGPTIEKMYGSREFFLFYMGSLLFIGLGKIGFDLFTGLYHSSLGASGAIMAIIVLFAIHFPTHRVLLFMIIPIEMRYLVWLYAAFDLYPLLLQLRGTYVQTNIGHAAHVLGMVFGFLYWKLAIRLDPLLSRVTGGLPARGGRRRRGAGQPKLRVYRPETESKSSSSDSDEVDRILAKIHEQGQDSLTKAERAILEKASEEMRRRRGQD